MADTRNSNTTHYHLGDFTRFVIAIAETSQNDALFIVRFLKALVRHDDAKASTLQPSICRVFNTLSDSMSEKDQAIIRMIVLDLSCNERRRLKELLATVGQNYITSLHAHLTKSPPKDLIPSSIRSGGSTVSGLDIDIDEVLYLFLEEKKYRLLHSIKKVTEQQNTVEAKRIYKKYQMEYLDTLLLQIETVKDAEHVKFERLIFLMNQFWCGIDAMRSEYLDDCQPYIAYSMRCLNVLIDALGRVNPPLYSLDDLEQLLLKGINASKMKEYDPRDVYELSLLKLKMAKIKEKQQQSSAVVNYYEQAWGHLGKCIQLVDESILAYSADLEDYARARRLDYLNVGVCLMKVNAGQAHRLAECWSLIKFLLENAKENFTSLIEDRQGLQKLGYIGTEKPFARADIEAALSEICDRQIDIIDAMLDIYIQAAFNDSRYRSMHFDYIKMCDDEIAHLARCIKALPVEEVNDSDNNNNNNTSAFNLPPGKKLEFLRRKFVDKKFEHIKMLLKLNDLEPIKQVNNLSMANVILTNHLRDETLMGNQEWLKSKKELMATISELRTKALQGLNQKKSQPEPQIPAFLVFLKTISAPNSSQNQQQQRTQKPSEENNNSKNKYL